MVDKSTIVKRCDSTAVVDALDDGDGVGIESWLWM
jgi:hypothetical protein